MNHQMNSEDSMMKAKRILSALLAALLLAGTMTACGESQDPPREETTANQVTETEAETDLSDGLPDDLDFGGQEITFISRYLEGWTSGEIAVEGLINEPVNDAIYERNKAVEDRLKIEINSIEENNSDPNLVVTKVDNAVKAGTNEYSVLAAACYVALPSTLNGNYVNLRGEGAEYLDLEQPYWAQGLNEVIEYGGTQFAVTGEALITLYRMAFVTCFNQALFDNASQPYLYDYVDNGTWTLDKQISLVPLFHQDNGNGQQDDEGDIYGFASGTMASIDPYWSSCKVDIIRKNGEGMYELVLDNDRIHGVSEKVLRLFHNTDGASRIFQSHGYGGEHDDIGADKLDFAAPAHDDARRPTVIDDDALDSRAFHEGDAVHAGDQLVGRPLRAMLAPEHAFAAGNATCGIGHELGGHLRFESQILESREKPLGKIRPAIAMPRRLRHLAFHLGKLGVEVYSQVSQIAVVT
jgi:hypothetical protein